MNFARIMMLLVALTFVGCGGPKERTKDVQPPSAQEEMTMCLQHVADTGKIDSGLMTVREKLEAMKATDAAKAEELLKDLDELEQSSGDAAKEKASAMLGKL